MPVPMPHMQSQPLSESPEASTYDGPLVSSSDGDIPPPHFEDTEGPDGLTSLLTSFAFEELA
eukprot:9350913-Alexandrium_andersonii.AAC.1